MKTWIYPGSFDPITVGHLDIIKRAAKLCDLLVVAVLHNTVKQSVLSPAEKAALIRRSVTGLENVSVETFEGLTVDFARKRGACALVRGIRSSTDFDYEFQISLLNSKLNSTIETIFLPADPQTQFVSSSVVRELAFLGADFRAFVPPEIYGDVKSRYSPQGGINL